MRNCYGLLWVWLFMVLSVSPRAVAQDLNEPNVFESDQLSEDEWLALLDRRKSTSTIANEGDVIYWHFWESGLLIQQDLNGYVQVLDTLDTEEFPQMNLDYLPQDHALLVWDAGVGRVFEYDLATKEFTRMDDSYNFKSFFDHADFVFPERKMIYGFGGYGEFTHKEVLLYYSPEDKEWTDILYFGDRPDPLFYGGFHYDDNENLFYFTQYIGFFVYIYQVNPESWEWTLLDKFDLEDKPFGIGFSSGLNSFDPNTGLIYLFGSFFYDTQAQVVRKYSISEGLFTKIDPAFMASYDREDQRWLLLGQRKVGKPGVYFTSLRLTNEAGEDRFYEIISPYRPSEMNLYLLGFIVWAVLIGIFLVLYFRSPKGGKKSTSMESIHLHDSYVEVHTKTGVVRFNEDLDRKFWTFVHDLKTQGIHSSDLKEFDAQVFNGNGNDSQNSVLRKKLITHVNAKLGVEFIQIKRSELDKRYRKILFLHGSLER